MSFERISSATPHDSKKNNKTSASKLKEMCDLKFCKHALKSTCNPLDYAPQSRI